MKTGRIVLQLLVVISFVVLSGCFPRKTVVWSPDGNNAAICSKDGLYFTDKDGNVSGKVYDYVVCAAWGKDNETVVIEAQKNINSWQELERLCSASVLSEMKTKVSYFEGISTIEQWQAKEQEYGVKVSGNELNAIKLYYSANMPDGVSEELVENWKTVEEFKLYTIERCIWRAGEFTVVKELCQFVIPVWDISISPTGEFLMMTACDVENDSNDIHDTTKLWLMDLEANRVELFDKGVSLYPTWSKDGNSVIYVSKSGGDEGGVFFGKLVRAKVVGDDGKLVGKVDSPEILAGIVMNVFTKVCELPDGKIIFSTLEVDLPIVPEDFSGQMQLFMLDPSMHSGLTRIVLKKNQEEVNGFDMNLFEVSSDGRYISLADQEGRVAVLDLFTGKMTSVQEDKGYKSSMIPVWRNDNELYYLGHGSDEAGDIAQVRCRDMSVDGADEVFSKEWPDQIADGLKDN